ncbi:DUF3520 domain-containing protein [Sphingobacteriales bacterium UPWRP_1]|nr:hypothetical protein BVG80_01370 [Sphingobacteriales bacterium TSM_CSM]PSJ72868.1 DUF3520 domain-containing protein [Sphingobacteriales bacterium UPWRP_1]
MSKQKYDENSRINGNNTTAPAFSPPPQYKESELSYDMRAYRLTYADQPAMPQGGYNQLFEEEGNTEAYNYIQENDFKNAAEAPLSTFSIDVDKASYSNVRRFITNGQLPPADAVRIEEMVNYFTYDYPQPKGNDPFSITTEVAECPWNTGHYMALVGLQGKKIDMSALPPNRLTFLIDVSGSMSSYNKLPLLKKAFGLLTQQLRPQDKVALVVYAGAAGVVLEPTQGNQKETILAALDRLEAGGSTAGGEGIELAYKTAQQQFDKNANNRVILATDGDFNVGASSDSEMTRLIEQKRNTGIYLTVLGFGMGNYKDSKMELLADKGNGNYAYIDDLPEAKKVLVNELGATLFTIAKDVKIQVEFNPARVAQYRLIGYENRLLNAEDFNDDTKDAGELGAGHSVTALYELIPAKANEPVTPKIDPLKYQNTEIKPSALNSNELMTVKFRYKPPQQDNSLLIEHPVNTAQVGNYTNNFTFAASVASFGMLLRNSNFKGASTYAAALEMAKQGQGTDTDGYRKEFIDLVQKAISLK